MGCPNKALWDHRRWEKPTAKFGSLAHREPHAGNVFFSSAHLGHVTDLTGNTQGQFDPFLACWSSIPDGGYGKPLVRSTSSTPSSHIDVVDAPILSKGE